MKKLNPLEELFVHQKKYKGYARIKKSGSKPLQSDKGQMAVYWDENLAKDELQGKEIIVECEITYFIL